MAARLTKDQVKSNFEKINNWGRWGKEDERGALNYITPEKRAAAAKLAKAGEIVISETTYAECRDVVEVEPREPVSVKGKSLPIAVYSVTALKRGATPNGA